MPRHGRNTGPTTRQLKNVNSPLQFNQPFSIPVDVTPHNVAKGSDIFKADAPSSGTAEQDLSVNTVNVLGSATFAAGLDVNGASIIHVGDPLDPTDVVNKQYVDEKVTCKPLLAMTSLKDGDTIEVDTDENGLIISGQKDALKSLSVIFPQKPKDGQQFTILSSVKVGKFSVKGAQLARGHIVSSLAAGDSLHFLYNEDTNRWYLA